MCTAANTCSEKNCYCLGGTRADTVLLDCLKKVRAPITCDMLVPISRLILVPSEVFFHPE